MISIIQQGGMALLFLLSVSSSSSAQLNQTYTFDTADPLKYWSDWTRDAAYVATISTAGQAIENESLRLSYSGANAVFVLRSMPSRLPLLNGKRYVVEFNYRMLSLGSSASYFSLYLRNTSFFAHNNHILITEDHPILGVDYPMQYHFTVPSNGTWEVAFKLNNAVSVVIDNLNIRQNTSPAKTAGQSVSSTDYTPYGINAFFEHGTQYPDNQTISNMLSRIDEAGFQWLRLGLRWAWIEPTEGGAYSKMDLYHYILNQAAERDIKVLLIVAGVPLWARPANGTEGVDWDKFDEFSSWLTDMVLEFGDDVDYWEVGNEVDGEFWGTSLENYKRYLQEANTVIKAADSTDKILLASITVDGVHHQWSLSDRVEFFMQKVYDMGMGSLFDIVAIHPYSTDVENSLWESVDKINTLYEVMSDNGDGGKPIWITEFGGPAELIGTSGQETIIRDMYIYGIKHPRVEKVFAYHLADKRYVVDTKGYGLFTTNYVAKPAYYEFRDEVYKYPSTLREKNWGLETETLAQ